MIDFRLVRVVMLAIMIAEVRQRDLVLSATGLVLRPCVLHAVGVAQVFVLILASRTELLNHVGDGRVDLPKHHSLLVVHTYICVVIYTPYASF